MDPILTGRTLDLTPMASDAVLTITRPNGQMTEHPPSEGTVELAVPGTYTLGVVRMGEHPRALPPLVIPPNAAEALAAWRAGASMDVTDFALASLAAGLISKADAKGWVTGRATPPIVDAALLTIPEGPQRDAAEIRILGATVVHRVSPFVGLMQGQMGLTDDQVDALFGWTA